MWNKAYLFCLFIGITISKFDIVESFHCVFQDVTSPSSFGFQRKCMTLFAYPSSSRREVLSAAFRSTTVLSTILLTGPSSSGAASATTTTADEDVKVLSDCYEALSSLLENWDKATIDCTYADVPRELLETKNKELLLEKAATSALFDKSASVVSCKKNNRIVRDYIGATGKGPLVGAEKRMLKRTVADRVDPDDLENYFNEVELFSQAISRASSLSYTAGVADFDSVNNFAKDDDYQKTSRESNLDQTKVAITEANNSLKTILTILQQPQ